MEPIKQKLFIIEVKQTQIIDRKISIMALTKEEALRKCKDLNRDVITIVDVKEV